MQCRDLPIQQNRTNYLSRHTNRSKKLLIGEFATKSAIHLVYLIFGLIKRAFAPVTRCLSKPPNRKR